MSFKVEAAFTPVELTLPERVSSMLPPIGDICAFDTPGGARFILRGDPSSPTVRAVISEITNPGYRFSLQPSNLPVTALTEEQIAGLPSTSVVQGELFTAAKQNEGPEAFHTLGTGAGVIHILNHR